MSYSASYVIRRHFLKKIDVTSGSGRRVITSVTMAEGACSRFFLSIMAIVPSLEMCYMRE